jgi:hypothetical protein
LISGGSSFFPDSLLSKPGLLIVTEENSENAGSESEYHSIAVAKAVKHIKSSLRVTDILNFNTISMALRSLDLNRFTLLNS